MWLSLDVHDSNHCGGEHGVADGEQCAVADAECAKGAVEVVFGGLAEGGGLCHVQALAVAPDARRVELSVDVWCV